MKFMTLSSTIETVEIVEELIDLDLDEVCDTKKTMETITEEEEEDNRQEELGIRE